jgi:hypothetical protein
MTQSKNEHDPDEMDVKSGNLTFKNTWSLLGILSHACNPSYLGGRDWEDYDPRSAGRKC